MSKGGSGSFSGTKGANKAFSDYPKTVHSGTGQPLGPNKERVDFGKPIGRYVDGTTGKSYPTTMGIIHYSKSGAHIVPTKPKNLK